MHLSSSMREMPCRLGVYPVYTTSDASPNINIYSRHVKNLYTGLTYFRLSNAFSPSGIDGQTKAKITFFLLHIASSENKHTHAGKGH